MRTHHTIRPHIHRGAIATALALGVLGTASACSEAESMPAGTSPASATTAPPAQPTVLDFTMSQKDSEFEMFDVGEKGDSIGDRNVSAATLERDGKVAGRMQGVCTTLDNAYEGHACDLVLIIEGGSLTLASGGVRNPIPHVDGRGDIFAVTGGTGDYVGAAGEMTVSDGGQTVTITLVPQLTGS